MTQRLRSALVTLAAAALMFAAAAAPCAARGTGGFLREWALCGPLDSTQLAEPALPDDFLAYPGLFAAGRVWVPVTAAAEGKIDLRTFYPRVVSGTVLLATYFEIPADGAYRLRIGSDDAVRVEIDGRTVHTVDTRRSWQVDQDTVRLTLKAGWHRLLVRVINFGGGWAVSVRMADSKDRPIDVRQQAAVPPPLETDGRLDATVPPDERAEAVAFLTAQAERLRSDLAAALPRLAEMPAGYVTFAEYEGARAMGLKFFEAMASFWREASEPEWDEAAARLARESAVEAARGFSEVLAHETDRMARTVVANHRVWETLGGEGQSRRDFAAATLHVADLLEQSRRLALRVENERLRMARYENDIRNWRQRDVRVRVVDAAGRPVPDAEVEVVQTGHDFLFGCNFFAYRRWDDEKRAALYERRFRDLFNLAVVPAYWSVMEKRRGRTDWGPTDAAVRWCRMNDVHVKVHPLLWPRAVPLWIDDLRADEVRSAAQAHVQQVIQRYGAAADFWDVVHQPVAPGSHRPSGTDLLMSVGPLAIDPVEVLGWAADAQPRGRLLVSAPVDDDVAELVRRVREADARIDGLAIPARQADGVWTLDGIRRRLDEAAATGLPVHVSEAAIPGGPEDEAGQAEAVRHFYTAAFAHPKVESITWWDLSDRFAYQNVPTGLVRADLSPKPAYRALDRLVNHLWKTDAAGRTADDGRMAVRVFFGRYRITVSHGGRKAVADVHLGREGPGEVEVVLKPAK